jgi:hypothetical protein
MLVMHSDSEDGNNITFETLVPTHSPHKTINHKTNINTATNISRV